VVWATVSVIFLLDTAQGARTQQVKRLPHDFTDSLLASDLHQAIDFHFLPDERCLCLHKHGQVTILDISGTEVKYSNYAVVSTVARKEHGTLGFAIDPKFPEKPYVYFYSATPFGNSIIRYTHDERTGGASSRGSHSKVLWEGSSERNGGIHFGGGVSFGPDDMLYFTTGDQNVPENAQNLTEQAGKIHRIHRDGSFPLDNLGMQDGSGGNIDSVWAFGLRNPFRAAWDIKSNLFLFGDVGSNTGEDAWEEINQGLAGKNYGWPKCEGKCGAESQFSTTCECQKSVPEATRHETGVVNYRHSQFGNKGCVVAGETYWPSWGKFGQFPQVYHGKYFFTDHTIRTIFYVDIVNGNVQSTMHEFYNLHSAFSDDHYAGRPVALRVGPKNALFYIDYYQNSLRQISYYKSSEGNAPPKISNFVASPPSSVHKTLDVTFYLEATNDDEFETVTYTFVFGDGVSATVSSLAGSIIHHHYEHPGRYEANVIVTDSMHTVRSSHLVIQVGLPAAAKIVSPLDGFHFRGSETVQMHGVALDPMGLPCSGCEFEWELSLKHDEHFHPFLDGLVGTTVTFVAPSDGHEFYNNVTLEIRLTVTTADGLIATDTINIESEEVDVTFASSLPNIPISIVGVPYTAPHVHDMTIGFTVPVSAPSTVCHNFVENVFSHWNFPLPQTSHGCNLNARYRPMDMVGHGRTVERSIGACQARCTNAIGCVYFTFWSLDGGCHLADTKSKLKGTSGWQKVTSGDTSCHEPGVDLKPLIGKIYSNHIAVTGSPTDVLFTAVYMPKVQGNGDTVTCGDRLPTEMEVEAEHKPDGAPSLAPTTQPPNQLSTLEVSKPTSATVVVTSFAIPMAPLCTFDLALIGKRGNNNKLLQTYKKVKISGDCATKCLHTEACGGYSHQAKGKKCKIYTAKGVSTKKLKKSKKWVTYVKSCSSLPEPPPQVRMALATELCFVKQALSAEGIMQIGRGVDKIGKRVLASSAEECGAVCTQSDKCHHFAFNSAASGCKSFKASYKSGKLQLTADGSGMWDGYIPDLTWAGCQAMHGVKVPVV
jgi:glucose/arabinose dehydrogenase